MIGIFWSRGRLSFFPVALLFVVMTVSIGVFALATAPALRRHVRDRWALGGAGVASIGFAVGFLTLGFRWIRLEPRAFSLWMSSYFAFCAICMMALGLRLNNLRAAIHRIARK
jgi:multisubunit Na+/H+ antiporter MnhB subunit